MALFFIGVAIAVIFILKKENKKIDIQTVKAPGSPNAPNTSSLPKATPQSGEKKVYDKTPALTADIYKNDLKPCAPFLENYKSDSLEFVLKQIKKNENFEQDLPEMIEYQLLTEKNEEIVVQKTPSEEKKDQVKVFKIATDGFPDRVKEFPNSTLAVDLKLQGALTLGKIIKEIDKYQALNISGANLFYEVENEKVTRISFTKGKAQLLCEQLSCVCKSF